MKAAKLYRELQLLSMLCNSVQQNLIGSLIVAAIIAISIDVGFLVQLNQIMGNQSHFLVTALLVLSFADCFAIQMVLLGGMVSVCAESKKVLREAKNMKGISVSGQQKLLVTKMWRSCDKIKMKFSDNNFLEELTPLRCFDFSVDMTVNFLLLSRNT